MPELFEWRRAELRVETDRSARSVLDVLRRGVPPGLEILDLPADAGTLRLRLIDRRGREAPEPLSASPSD